MHVSPETMKTIGFVLLLLLVAVYMHLSQTPRREPRSLVNIARHRGGGQDAEPTGEGEHPGPPGVNQE